MKRELLQVGKDAESLARYIMEHGDLASGAVIEARARLLVFHVQDLKQAEGK